MPDAAPPVFKHLVQLTCSTHQITLLCTIRVHPIPSVDLRRAILVRPVQGLPNCYSVVARYGYDDVIDHVRGRSK